MSRITILKDTISRLEFIRDNKLSGYIIAEQIIWGLKYVVEVEDRKVSDLGLLEKLCYGGLPFKDIEAFDNKTINLIYQSFDEMKKLLIERKKNA